nr:immunoglobulin heavy chain junction region [Macaca mulatta]
CGSPLNPSSDYW